MEGRIRVSPDVIRSARCVLRSASPSSKATRRSCTRSSTRSTDRFCRMRSSQAYFAFRKRLRNIREANSCTCEACRGMQSLDVKFVVHHGEFIRQKMGAARSSPAGT